MADDLQRGLLGWSPDDWKAIDDRDRSTIGQQAALRKLLDRRNELKCGRAFQVGENDSNGAADRHEDDVIAVRVSVEFKIDIKILAPL
jgi:hypothetical protein